MLTLPLAILLLPPVSKTQPEARQQGGLVRQPVCESNILVHREVQQGSKYIRTKGGKWVEHPCLDTVSTSHEVIILARGVLSGMWDTWVHLDLSHSIGEKCIIVLSFNVFGIGSHSHWGTILSSVLMNNLPTFYFKIFKFFFFFLHLKIWINIFLKDPQGWQGLGLTVLWLLEIPVVHLNFNVSIICSSV